MEIKLVNNKEVKQILELQQLAYQSEAAIYQDYTIPPLTQSVEEIREEFKKQVFLKAVFGQDLVGSVRSYSDGDTCFIGRLIVHPDWQRKGIGTKLMEAIENHFTEVKRYELFTGNKSVGNIRLYKSLGYSSFKEQEVNDSLTLVFLEKLSRTVVNL